MSIAIFLFFHWLHRYHFFFNSILNVEIIYFITSLFSFRSFSSFFFSNTHYDIYNFDNNLFKHFTYESWKFHISSINELSKKTFETLNEKFSRICMLVFTMKSNLKQKIHAASARYNQIHVQKMHNQNTRRRNFDWKKK